MTIPAGLGAVLLLSAITSWKRAAFLPCKPVSFKEWPVAPRALPTLLCFQATAPGPADHGPFCGDRVAHLPRSPHCLWGRRPPRGPGLHHLRGCACQARLQPVFLAPCAYVSGLLLPDDRGAAGVLSGEFAAARLLAEGPSTLPLGAAAAGPAVRAAGPGPGHPPQRAARQSAPGHAPRAGGAAGCAVGRAAVLGGRGAALPEAAAPMAPGEAQAVPRHFWAGGLPAGQCQPLAGHVLTVVHSHCHGGRLVPGCAVPHPHQLGHHEPGEQRLPVSQEDPAVSSSSLAEAWIWPSVQG